MQGCTSVRACKVQPLVACRRRQLSSSVCLNPKPSTLKPQPCMQTHNPKTSTLDAAWEWDWKSLLSSSVISSVHGLNTCTCGEKGGVLKPDIQNEIRNGRSVWPGNQTLNLDPEA